MLRLLLVALYTMRKEQHGPIPTTRANVELHQDAVTPQQQSSSQLRYSDQEYEADDHYRLKQPVFEGMYGQCLKVCVTRAAILRIHISVTSCTIIDQGVPVGTRHHMYHTVKSVAHFFLHEYVCQS